MKTFFLSIFLSASVGTFAQNTIFVKSGKKIEADHISLKSKKSVDYKISDVTTNLKLSDFDSINAKSVVYKPMNIGKRKPHLLQILTSDKTRSLAMESRDRIKSRGGFESKINTYTFYLIQNGAVSQTISLTNSNTEKEVGKRRDFFDFVRQHFSDCPKFSEKISLLRSDSDVNFQILLTYLDNPEYTKCQ